MKRLTLMLLFLLAAVLATGQQRATTEDGSVVLLYPDGTWEFAEESGSEAVESPVTLELIRFGFTESGPANDYANDYSDWFDIVFAVNNSTDQDIRAARGVVVFEDLFGDELWRVNLRISDPLPAGESITWVGSVDYQMFNDSHKRMKNMRTQDMAVVYDEVQVIYEDAE